MKQNNSTELLAISFAYIFVPLIHTQPVFILHHIKLCETNSHLMGYLLRLCLSGSHLELVFQQGVGECGDGRHRPLGQPTPPPDSNKLGVHFYFWVNYWRISCLEMFKTPN